MRLLILMRDIWQDVTGRRKGLFDMVPLHIKASIEEVARLMWISDDGWDSEDSAELSFGYGYEATFSRAVERSTIFL